MISLNSIIEIRFQMNLRNECIVTIIIRLSSKSGEIKKNYFVAMCELVGAMKV